MTAKDMDTGLKSATDVMVSRISRVLAENNPSIYLYGSAVLDDFRLGWSDIDILVLTEKVISKSQADELLMLRQELLKGEPENKYYRSFEGEMLSLDAFFNNKADRVVY